MSDGGLTGGYQTTTKTMESVASEFDNINSQLQSKFSELLSDMQSVRDRWKGPAGDGFQKLMSRYNDDVVKLNQALKNIATNLHSNRQTYDTTQQKTLGAITDITSKLQG
jgi:WXG100 family type VII secretion target